jgi:hypothetical protein
MLGSEGPECKDKHWSYHWTPSFTTPTISLVAKFEIRHEYVKHPNRDCRNRRLHLELNLQRPSASVANTLPTELSCPQVDSGADPNWTYHCQWALPELTGPSRLAYTIKNFPTHTFRSDISTPYPSSRPRPSF